MRSWKEEKQKERGGCDVGGVEKKPKLFEQRPVLLGGKVRAKQTWVEHAAHIIALACVSHRYALEPKQRTLLLVAVEHLTWSLPSCVYLRPPWHKHHEH